MVSGRSLSSEFEKTLAYIFFLTFNVVFANVNAPKDESLLNCQPKGRYRSGEAGVGECLHKFLIGSNGYVECGGILKQRVET